MFDGAIGSIQDERGTRIDSNEREERDGGWMRMGPRIFSSQRPDWEVGGHDDRIGRQYDGLGQCHALRGIAPKSLVSSLMSRLVTHLGHDSDGRGRM